MSRVFNLSQYNNLRKAIDIYYPPSKAVREKMTQEELEKASPLPVVPFSNLVEQTLGRRVDQIDHQTLNELAEYYLSLFNSPESIGPAFESVKSFAVDIEPTKKIEQLRAALNSLYKDKTASDLIQKVKATFGDNPTQIQKFKEMVFSKFGLKYDENLIAIFKQRVNANTIPNIAALYEQNKEAGADNSEVLIIARQLRQDYIAAASNAYNDFVDKCRSYGLIDSQIFWIMNHGKSADPTKLPFFATSNIDPQIISDLLSENNIVATQIRQNFTENPAFLFSQNVDAMKKQGLSEEQISTMLEIGSQVGGSIARDEYLDSVNLSRIEVPEDPNDLVDNTYDPNSELSREEQIRLNPRNLKVVKALLEKGGYIIGGKAVKRLPSFLSESKTAFQMNEGEAWQEVQSLYGQGKTLESSAVEFPSGSYADRALWYIASTICENKDNFRSMIESSTAISENDQDGQELVDENGEPIKSEEIDPRSQYDILFGKTPLLDERYKDFNFEHDAIDQKRAVEMLRNSFGLEVVPSEMGIPALDDCNINVEGFQIDFVVICSALQTWIQSGEQYHPVINEQVNFVGEYYGFNFDFKKSLKLFEDDGRIADTVIDTETNKPKKITRVEHPEGVTMPDGSLAKVKLRKNPGDSSKDKVEMDASYGTPIDAGSTYKIRTAWKRMTEDFAAVITGNAAIHIPPDFTERDIMEELNKCNIIYKLTGVTVPNSPLMLIDNHAKECADPQCDSKKTSESGDPSYFKKYNVKEAMVISKIVEFKMTHGLVPKLREEKAKTARAKKVFQDKMAEELRIDPKDLWNSMSYKDFLDRFNSEHDLGIKGFGRHEIYQYYSQKSVLENELFQLRKSPEYSFDKEILLRQQIQSLKEKHLRHFQEIFDAHATSENPEALFYRENLKKLEALKEEVSTGQDSYTNQQLASILDQLVQSYVPQVVAQKKKAFTNFDLFRIAIRS